VKKKDVKALFDAGGDLDVACETVTSNTGTQAKRR